MTSAAAAMYSQSLLLPMITPTIGILLSAIVVPRTQQADSPLRPCQAAAGMSAADNSAQCIRDGDADSDKSVRVHARGSRPGDQRYFCRGQFDSILRRWG